MAKYLYVGSYTAQGAKGTLAKGGSARREAARKAVESVGGTIESFYFGFGADDFYLIYDAPSAAAAAALALTPRGWLPAVSPLGRSRCSRPRSLTRRRRSTPTTRHQAAEPTLAEKPAPAGRLLHVDVRHAPIRPGPTGPAAKQRLVPPKAVTARCTRGGR